MKINEIIKEKRLAKNMTQEQIAGYLGVTAPAVNKWEKGISYPDITLLPALARLLGTDLNTLLSFKDELTEKEISLFINHLSDLLDKNGFEAAYITAVEKLKEYPTCYPLLLNTALFLDGAILLEKKKKDDFEEYRAEIESIYERVLNSPDHQVQHQAQTMLISRYMGRKEYQKAEEILQTIPDKTFVDKKQIQANLFIATGRLEDAIKLEEEKLLSSVNEIQTTLITLMEIALKEDRIKDAEYIADISKKSAELFDSWEYNIYLAHFQLYATTKDKVKCLKVLIPMLKSLTHKWEINQSPLYRHLKTKDTEKDFGRKMQKSILHSIQESEETSFLKGNPEFQDFAKEIEHS